MQGLAVRALSSQRRDEYLEQGFLVLDGALNDEELDALRAETVRICRGEAGSLLGVESVGPRESDADVLTRYACIHMPHKVSELMYRTMAHPVTMEVITGIIGPNVKCMQSMLFIKASGKPGQAWHQDEAFIPTRDRSLNAAWIAVDDATTENGCLWAIPGSHKSSKLWPMREQDDPDFDCTDESFNFPYEDDDAVPLEASAGSIVFFNGYLLHRSLPNKSSIGFRRALVNHFMSAESLLPWSVSEGEQVGLADYRDVVIVAGSDPYAYKGYPDIARAHVRPDREGGCKPWPRAQIFASGK